MWGRVLGLIQGEERCPPPFYLGPPELEKRGETTVKRADNLQKCYLYSKFWDFVTLGWGNQCFSPP